MNNVNFAFVLMQIVQHTRIPPAEDHTNEGAIFAIIVYMYYTCTCSKVGLFKSILKLVRIQYKYNLAVRGGLFNAHAEIVWSIV